jgi:DNA-3-methyladenine glycosylase
MAQRRFGRRQSEWTNGPGRLTAAMGINKQHSGLNTLDPSCTLYFEEGKTIAQAKISAGPRIGINAPEPSRSLPWRFWIKGNPYVSSCKRS